MSKVQMVIEIDELFYEATLMLVKAGEGSAADIAVANGTPLPEHHGRLGDLDALEEYFRNVRKELKASDKSLIEFYVRDEMLLNFQQFIHLCDAIIEGSESE